MHDPDGDTATILPPAPLPDHVRIDSDSAVLATIDQPQVTLAVWERPTPLPTPDLEGFPRSDSRRPRHRSRRRARGAGRPALPALARDAAADAARLAMLYATWTGEERVEVRIERVTGNGC